MWGLEKGVSQSPSLSPLHDSYSTHTFAYYKNANIIPSLQVTEVALGFYTPLIHTSGILIFCS